MPSQNSVEPRIVVVGTSGSGKTTTARRIAKILAIPHIELDAIHWGPNWTSVETPVLRERVREAVTADRWVLDGNYKDVRNIVWERATTVVWLNYPFWLVMWRIVSRTFVRSLRREELWNGNRENFRQSFFSRNSVIVWAFNTYHRRRNEYPILFQQPEYAHLNVIVHRAPKETDRWLRDLAMSLSD
jgi:adenylate kinase family enzyme